MFLCNFHIFNRNASETLSTNIINNFMLTFKFFQPFPNAKPDCSTDPMTAITVNNFYNRFAKFFIYLNFLFNKCNSHINGRKIFLITGVGENEGKSTVAGNVAAMMAMKGKNTALVDCDLRKPAMRRFFDGACRGELSLDQMLAEPFSVTNFRRCMARHPKLGLYTLFPEKASTHSVELLSGATTASVFQQLRVFDCVIVDSPPMGFFADTLVLADLADASVLVVRQDCTPACDVNEAADSLRGTKSAFLGCVLNDMWGHSGSGWAVSPSAATAPRQGEKPSSVQPA